MSLKDAPNKTCSGSPTKNVRAMAVGLPLGGVRVCLELVLNYGSFRFRTFFSPAAGNASRWALTGTYFWKEKRVSEIF